MRQGQIMTTYQIQIRGHLDKRWEATFPDFTIRHQFSTDEQPLTLMTGEVSDQAALYGVINRLRNLGVELISFQPKNNEENQGDNEHATE
jgi:hypothetical protein